MRYALFHETERGGEGTMSPIATAPTLADLKDALKEEVQDCAGGSSTLRGQDITNCFRVVLRREGMPLADLPVGLANIHHDADRWPQGTNAVKTFYQRLAAA
jgi:hypothetical protein